MFCFHLMTLSVCPSCHAEICETQIWYVFRLNLIHMHCNSYIGTHTNTHTRTCTQEQHSSVCFRTMVFDEQFFSYSVLLHVTVSLQNSSLIQKSLMSSTCICMHVCAHVCVCMCRKFI